MIDKDILEWSSEDVADYFLQEGLEVQAQLLREQGVRGIDLIELTESELKLDMLFNNIHERKHMLRLIQDLRNKALFKLKVEYQGQSLSFRISSPDSYFFKQLAQECSRVLKIPEEEVVFKDKSGYMLGSGSVSILFDSKKEQCEPVYISVFESESSEDSIDSEDFNEHNPYHNCLK